MKSQQKSEEEDCCCNEKSRKYISLSSLIVFILPLVSVIKIAVDEFSGKLTSDYANCGLIITYLIVLVTFGYMVVKSHKLKVVLPSIATTDELKALDTSVSLVSKGNLAIFTFISILGLGDSLFNLTSAGNQLLYIINATHPHRASSVFIIIENCIKLYYHLCLLLFLMSHEHYLNVLKCITNKAFIFALSISCFVQWFLAIVQELRHQKLLDDHGHENITIISIDNSGHVNVASFIQIQRFLLPFSIEYRIILFIEFFCIYLFKNEKQLFRITLNYKIDV